MAFLRNIFVVAALAGNAIFLVSCTSATPNPNKFSCKQSDWYEIGRRDGSAGHPLRKLQEYRKQCGQELSAEDETLYTNGRNAGLVEYCTPKNAVELGRMQVTYFYVCPSTVEAEFLQSYKKGERARSLELENQKLSEKIDKITQKITQQPLQETARRSLASQLQQLKQLHARNERELSQITK